FWQNRLSTFYGTIIIDGFVKSHSAVLHFIFRHCSVRKVRFIPQDSCALHNELFTLPSEF
ncbi:MAG: hypothetical protein KKH85_10530, partial [Proteobacteria bacterium]|nr:hypothetical protein [Pseudomonadota bacterium]